MKLKDQIENSKLKGRKIVRELGKNKKIIEIDNPMPVGEDGIPIKTYSADEVENMIWDRMSDLYGVDIRKL